jgi:hypothetical protein
MDWILALLTNSELQVRRGADKSLAFPISYLQHNKNNFSFDRLKKLEQQDHNCVELRGGGGGICKVNKFFQSRSLFSL